jgi:Flp pilus assembly protein TadD
MSVPVTDSKPSIYGHVIVNVQILYERIEIFLEYETGRTIYTHVAPSQPYVFYDLAAGTYYMIIEVPGFEKIRERIDVRGDPLTIPKPIFLVPEGSSSASSGAAPVNVDFRRKYSRKAAEEFEKGQDELAKGDLKKAAERLAAAVKEAPTFFEAQNLLGTVYYKLQRLPEAESAYRKAREIDPKSPLPSINLGMLLIEAADAGADKDPAAAARVYNGAREVLSDAVELDPESAMATFLLGVSCYRLSLYDEAEAHLKRAVELNGRMGQARIMLANGHIRKQEWDAALEHLDAYLEANPRAPDADRIRDTQSKVEAAARARGVTR